MKKYLWIIPLIVVGLLYSCSQESSSYVSRAFHNTTAKFNAYFLAKEKMLEIERDIEAMHVDDYNVIIDVLPTIDSTKTKGLKSKFDYCAEKASLPIEKHKNSNWVDDSYILLGKLRMYKGKNDLAIRTFKYVVQMSKDENMKQLALSYLIRCYLEEKNYLQAEEAIDLLKDEKLHGETEKVFHLNYAHYNHKLRKYELIPASLEKAIPHIKSKDQRARMHFIIGQVHQKYGNSALALKHFSSATKRNPPYETEFFARLCKSREVTLGNEKQVKKSEKFYRYSLKEEKNKEYRGRIYYEKALFELKKEKLDSTITLLELSAKQNDKYSSQKGYTYERLGNIYFEREPLSPQKESYKLSKIYYDSTVNVISESVEGYDSIIERHDILTRFVKHVLTIEEEDSLQGLSKLSKEELEKRIDDWVVKETERKKQEIIRAREAEKKKKREQTLALFEGESNFVFYNPTALAQAKERFKEQWGSRKLEDNWRRASKQTLNTTENEAQENNAGEVQKENTEEEEEIKVVVDRNDFTKNIPTNDAELLASKAKVLYAYNQLGKIYDFELKDPQRAYDTYTSMLSQYPQNKYEAEVLYSLYKICLANEFCDEQDYARQLFARYPNATFTKLVKNPNYITEYKDKNVKADLAYEKAYQLFLNGQYFQADVAINEVQSSYPDADVLDKVVLLKALILAKRNELEQYEASLIAFKNDFKTSNLIPYVDGLLEGLKGYEEDKVNTTFEVIDTTYLFNLGEKHYFVSFFKKGEIDYNETLSRFAAFHSKNFPSENLSPNLYDFGNGLWMLRVGLFGFRQGAEKYQKTLLESNSFYKDYLSKEKNRFVMTKSNFFILESSKDIDGYKTFYQKRYLKSN